jgi:rubrerythrin
VRQNGPAAANRKAMIGETKSRVSRLEDGTPYFGKLGKMAYDSDEDKVQCHLCGRWMKVVGGTHIRWHGWTLQGYRAAFQLRENVATCSAGLSGRLRHIAKAKIGRGGFASPPAGAGGSIRSTPRWRSVARLHPLLAAELHPQRNGQLNPDELAAGSKRKVWWLCGRCGHAWQATVGNRVARQSGCPSCALERRARSQSQVGRDRSLAVNRPDLARELHSTRNDGLDAETLAVFSTKKVWWLCRECAHEWETTPANRSRGGTGCPACWRRRRGPVAMKVPYERSLAAKDPDLAAELHPEHTAGVDPSRIGARSDQKLWWRCKICGHPWSARVADRSAGTGCPACARQLTSRIDRRSSGSRDGAAR